jgi:N-acetylglucosamine-6-phosphate deacetylase
MKLQIFGLVDVHCHGAFGTDFMSASRQDLVDLSDKLREIGYTAWLPTTVTASLDSVRRALDQLPEHAMIPGFHLEGPFISKVYPGAQPPEYILNPADAKGWDVVLDDPRLKVITMAPELPGSLDLIRRLTARGVIVSLGHTNATYEECQAAYVAGARHTTHTFNAMRPLHHREPGTVGFALSEDGVSTELIYDRLHVSTGAAKVLHNAKPDDRVIGISDSTMATGLPAGTALNMWGHDCLVGGGEVRLAGSGTLAGSGITLADAFRNLAEDFGVAFAVQACSLNPARALGLDTSEPRFTVGDHYTLQSIGT